MQETWIQPLSWEDSLEKGMENHSSILTYKNPWTESLVGYSPWVTERQTQLSTKIKTYHPHLIIRKAKVLFNPTTSHFNSENVSGA